MADTRLPLVTAASANHPCTSVSTVIDASNLTSSVCNNSRDNEGNKHSVSKGGNSCHLINGSANGKLANSDSSSGCEEDSHDHTSSGQQHTQEQLHRRIVTVNCSNKCDLSKQPFVDTVDGSVCDEDEAVDIEECDSSSSASVCDLLDESPNSLCKLLYTTNNSVVITSDQLYTKVVNSSAKDISKGKLSKFSTSNNLPNGNHHNGNNHTHSQVNSKKHHKKHNHHHHHPTVTVASISSTNLQVRRGSEPVLNRNLSPESLLFGTGNGIDCVNNKRWSTAVAVDSKRFGSQHRKLLSSDQYLDCDENEESSRKSRDQTRNQINSSHHSDTSHRCDRDMRDSSPSGHSNSSSNGSTTSSTSDTCVNEYQGKQHHNHHSKSSPVDATNYSHPCSSQMTHQVKTISTSGAAVAAGVPAVVDAAVSYYLSPSEQSRVATISVKSEPGPLGIHVVPYSDSIRDRQKDGMMIEMIEPKGRIHQDGRFNVGDWIIEVNGKSLLGIDFDAAQEIFKQALKVSAEINLKVIKSSGSPILPDQSSNNQQMANSTASTGNVSSITTPSASSRSLQSSNSNNVSSSSPSPASSSCIPCPQPSSVVTSLAYVKSTTVTPPTSVTSTATATIKSLSPNKHSNHLVDGHENQKNYHQKKPPNVLPKPPLCKVVAAEAAAAAAAVANSTASCLVTTSTQASTVVPSNSVSPSACMAEAVLPSAPVRSKKSATITSTRRLSSSPSKKTVLEHQSPVPSIVSSNVIQSSPVKSDVTQVSPFKKNASNRSRSSGGTGRKSHSTTTGKVTSKSASNSPDRSYDGSSGVLIGDDCNISGKKIGKKYHIRLLKRATGLGFSITTRDNPAGTGVPPIYIKNILAKGSAIFDGRLKQGDRLLEVNGTEITGKSQEETVDFLKSIPVGKFVDLIVSRQEPLYQLDPLPSPSVPRKIPPEKAIVDDTHGNEKPREVLTFEIPLNDTGSAGLGVSVKGRSGPNPDDPTGAMTDCGIFVKTVITGGAASKDGRLKPNDQLISINEISLLGMTNREASETLRKVMMSLPDGLDTNPGVMILTIARRLDVSCMLNESRHSSSCEGVSEFSEDATAVSPHGRDDDHLICYSTTGEQGAEQEEHYLTTSGAAMTGPLTQIPLYMLQTTGKVVSSTESSVATASSASPAVSSTSALHTITSSNGGAVTGSPCDRLTSVDSTSKSDLERESESSFKPDECTQLAGDPFTRDGFGRQSMSEKRHAHLNAKQTETYKRSKKAREEKDDASLSKSTPGRLSDRSHTRSAHVEHHRTASGSSYQQSHHRSSSGSSRVRSKSAHAAESRRTTPYKQQYDERLRDKEIESIATSVTLSPETGARAKTSVKGGIFSPSVCCWTGTCQSPGSCPYHPDKEKKSHQHASDSKEPAHAAAGAAASSALGNTGTTGLTRMAKSSSLENIDCLMQDLQKLQLASQSDSTGNTGQTATNRLTVTGATNHVHHTPATATGVRAATLRVSRASRVKNESFRAAVDKSYDTAVSPHTVMTMHPQAHQSTLLHHSARGDPSNMETVAEESSENDGSYLGTVGNLPDRNNVRLMSHSRPQHQGGMGVGLGFHSQLPSVAAISMNSAATGFSNITTGTATTATTATTTSSAEDDLVFLVKTGSSKKERKGGILNKFFKFGSRKCKTPPATSSHLPTVEQIIKELEKDAEKIRAKRQAQHEQERIQEALIRLKEQQHQQHQQQQHHQQQQQQQQQQQAFAQQVTGHGPSMGPTRLNQIHPVSSLQPEVMQHAASAIRNEAIYSGSNKLQLQQQHQHQQQQQQLYSAANQQQHLHHAHRMAQAHQLYQQQQQQQQQQVSSSTSGTAGDPIYQSRGVLAPSIINSSSPMYQSSAHVLPNSNSNVQLYQQQQQQQQQQLYGQSIYQATRQQAQHMLPVVSDDYGHYMNYQQIQESRRSLYPVRGGTTSTLSTHHPQHFTSLSSRPLPSHPSGAPVQPGHQVSALHPLHHQQQQQQQQQHHPPPLPPGRPTMQLNHPSSSHLLSQGQSIGQLGVHGASNINAAMMMQRQQQQQPVYQSSNVYIYQRPTNQQVHAPTQTTSALYSTAPGSGTSATAAPRMQSQNNVATVLTQSHSQVPSSHYYPHPSQYIRPASHLHPHAHLLPEPITHNASSAYLTSAASGQPIYGSTPASGYTSSPML